MPVELTLTCSADTKIIGGVITTLSPITTVVDGTTVSKLCTVRDLRHFVPQLQRKAISASKIQDMFKCSVISRKLRCFGKIKICSGTWHERIHLLT